MSWWAHPDVGISLPSRRFHHSLTDNNRWIRERSHESYAKNYSVVFPHDEPLAGRNVRKDPLHEVRTAPGLALTAAKRSSQGVLTALSLPKASVLPSIRPGEIPARSQSSLGGFLGHGQFKGRDTEHSRAIELSRYGFRAW